MLLLTVETLSSRIPRSKVTCIFNHLQQRWLWLKTLLVLKLGLRIHDLYAPFGMEATSICWESTFIV